MNHRRGRSGGRPWPWRQSHWALWRGKRLGCNLANQIGDLSFDRRPWAGVHRYGHESRKHFQCSSQRGRRSLRTEQGRQRVGRLVAGAGGYHVADGMMKLIRGALDALKIIAKRSHDRLFHAAGFLCHAGFRGVFRPKSPVLAFWVVGGLESTGWRYRCAQLLLNKQEP